MLGNCTGNADTVKCGCTTSHLVKYNKAVGSCIFQDIRDLTHLHHECGLSCCQVIGRSDTGEYLVHNGYLSRIRRNEASYLSHEHDKGCLTHICGFTRHIGSRDNGHTVSLIVDVDIIRHEHLISQHKLHYGMAACLYIDSAVNGDIGLYVLIAERHICK